MLAAQINPARKCSQWRWGPPISARSRIYFPPASIPTAGPLRTNGLLQPSRCRDGPRRGFSARSARLAPAVLRIDNVSLSAMRNFKIDIEIRAPADRVWEVMRDVERWPEWTPTVTSIRRIDAGPLAVGSRAVVRQPKLLPARWKVTELEDRNRTFTWITRGPGMRITAEHRVATIRDGSRASLSLHFSGPLGGIFARLTRNLNQRYLALEARGLKERSEGA